MLCLQTFGRANAPTPSSNFSSHPVKSAFRNAGFCFFSTKVLAPMQNVETPMRNPTPCHKDLRLLILPAAYSLYRVNFRLAIIPRHDRIHFTKPHRARPMNTPHLASVRKSGFITIIHRASDLALESIPDHPRNQRARNQTLESNKTVISPSARRLRSLHDTTTHTRLESSQQPHQQTPPTSNLTITKPQPGSHPHLNDPTRAERKNK